MTDITDKVRINSSTELELLEDARKGDLIHLDQLVKVDLLPIQEAIKEGKEKLYLQNLASEKDKWNSEKQAELSKQTIVLKEERTKSEQALKDTINELKQQNALLSQTIKQRKESLPEQLKNAKREKENELQDQINHLNREKQQLSSSLESVKKASGDQLTIALQKKEKERDSFYLSKLSDKDKEKEELNQKLITLRNQIEVLKATKESEIKTLVQEKENEKDKVISSIQSQLEKQKTENENNLLKQKAKDQETYQKLLDQYQSLRLEKSSHNVKRLGEGLEKWCNDEYQHYALSGFNDCLWLKDNAAVRDDGTTGAGGTKADYLFGIFSDSKTAREVKDLCDRKKNPSREKARTSVIRDRKNEDPNSTNKKTNASYFAKLDSDRKKKNCEYALLVSELERDNENYGFITKAQGYDKRYVVRPPYLRTFLSRLYSLTDHYRNILNEKGEEAILLKSRQDLLDEFDSLKDTYFDKPLSQREKDREAILKNCASIEKCNNEIKAKASEILQVKIGNRKNKIETFELKKRKTLLNKADKLQD